VNVPINQLEGEYLLLRAGSIIGLRIEPIFAPYYDQDLGAAATLDSEQE
jgi:hypothetical protein